MCGLLRVPNSDPGAFVLRIQLAVMSNRSSKSLCLINILTEDLLFEIFCRLPCCESVLQCKCVCKQWFNVISEPRFVAQFIAYKINAQLSKNSKCRRKLEGEEKDDPGVIYIKLNNQKSVIYTKNPPFTSPGRLDYWLDFLPCYRRKGHHPIIVEARCKNMLLCSSFTLSKGILLYICNPRTKQYLQLPAPSHRKRFCLVGFTWDPYYVFDKEAGLVTLNSSCQYTVFYSSTKRNIFDWQMLSSETGVWRKVIFSSPVQVGFGFENSMYKGVLHFYSSVNIVGFDAKKMDENGVIDGHLIRIPPYHASDTDYRQISVCNKVIGGQILVAKC